MFANKKLGMISMALAVLAGATGQALAGTGQGTVGQVLVGRLGHQVIVQLVGSVSGFPCGTPHPNGYNYMFNTQNPGGKDMLATVLAAKASGATLYFVGTGACSEESNIEDTSYIIAM